MLIPIEEAKKYPKKTDEQRVREILEREFGKALPKKRISLGNISMSLIYVQTIERLLGLKFYPPGVVT